MQLVNSFKKQLSQRLYWIRGVAIALVVIGHVIGYNLNYGMRQIYNSDLSILGWICDFINTFHMPTFFIASGIAFAAFSQKDISYQKFFSSKFQKLVIPLIVWCPPYFILQSLSKSNPFTITDVITSVIYPYEIFWFLHTLIFTTLLAFLYFKNFKSTTAYFLLSVVIFIASIFLNQLGWQLPLQAYCFWNIFYAFGILITKYLHKIELLTTQKHQFINLCITSLCFIFMVLCQYFLPPDASIDFLRLFNGIVGFILMYVISTQLFIQVNNHNLSIKETLFPKISNYIQYLGTVSMAIYLFHGYFTGVTKAILLKIFVLPNPALYFLLVSGMGIAGPILVYEIFRSRSKMFIYSIGATK